MTAGERRKKQMNEEENAIRQQGMPGMGDSYNIVMQKAASAGTNRPSDSAEDEQMMHRNKLMGTLGNIRQRENDFTQYVDNALKSLGEQQNARIGQNMKQGRLAVDLKPTAAMQYVDQNSAKSRTNNNQQGMQRIAMQKQQVAQGQAGLDHNVKAVQKQQVAQAQSGLDRNVKGMQKQQITQGQGGLDRNVQVMQQQEEQAHNRVQQIEAQRQAQREREAAAKRWRRRTKGSVIDALVNVEMATEGTELNDIFNKYEQGRISQANFEAAKERYVQKLKSNKITYYDKIDESTANLKSKKNAWEHLYLGATPEIAEKVKNGYDEALTRMNIFYDQLNYLNDHKEELEKVYGDVTLSMLSSYYAAKAKSERVGNTKASSELDKMIFNYGTEIKRLGGEQYLKTWNGLLDQNDIEVQDAYGKYEENIKSGKAYSMAELQKQLPHIANALEYKDNPEDNRNRAMGLAPAGSKEYIDSYFTKKNRSYQVETVNEVFASISTTVKTDVPNEFFIETHFPYDQKILLI